MKTFKIITVVEIELQAFTDDDALEAVSDSIREIEALGGIVIDSRLISIEEITQFDKES